MCVIFTVLCLSTPLSEAKSGSLALAIFTSVFCILCFTDFKQCQFASSEGKTQIWKDLLWNAETQRITLGGITWSSEQGNEGSQISELSVTLTMTVHSHESKNPRRRPCMAPSTLGKHRELLFGFPWGRFWHGTAWVCAVPGSCVLVCCGAVPLGRDRSLSLLCGAGLMDLHRGACAHTDTFPWLLVIFPCHVLGIDSGKSLPRANGCPPFLPGFVKGRHHTWLWFEMCRLSTEYTGPRSWILWGGGSVCCSDVLCLCEQVPVQAGTAVLQTNGTMQILSLMNTA